MNEKVQLVLFISIFLLLYGGINYFVLNNLYTLFNFQKNVGFYVIFIILTISYVLASVLESAFGNMLSKIIYYISAFWMGFLFLAFILILIYKILSFFFALPSFLSGIIIVSLTLLLCLIGIINAKLIYVRELAIYTDKVNSELRIVQISDVHFGPINGKGFLKNIVYTTNKLKPDYVFITGDLIDGRYNYNKTDFDILKSLHGKRYFITGNHETYAGIDYSIHLVDKLGLNVLRNEYVNEGNLTIIGIDDSDDNKWVIRKFNELYEFGHINNTNNYVILLYHRPSVYKKLSNKIDLMLSGHTHAGQIFPFSILAWLENKYLNGLYYDKSSKNGSKLYVSSGIGTWGPPIRLGSRSEIVLIKLLPKSD
ncbi:MAG: serine/threonine phosphatase [Candidatus Woesearchaeota archaeon]|nr:MAG: serine/threonine phosphatase [Candidatus Woesearchaeota archaeon]